MTREAYSREVISFGFWFGDDTFPEPAFYSYTAPEPAGLAEEPLQPAAAQWVARGGSHLAVLPLRRRPAPRPIPAPPCSPSTRAPTRPGARRAGWDIDRLACPGGVTDPYLRSRL